MFDLKDTQMNLQHSLIWELMLYQFELYHNNEEATQNVSFAKAEGIVDHSTVTRSFKKFRLK